MSAEIRGDLDGKCIDQGSLLRLDPGGEGGWVGDARPPPPEGSPKGLVGPHRLLSKQF